MSQILEINFSLLLYTKQIVKLRILITIGILVFPQNMPKVAITFHCPTTMEMIESQRPINRHHPPVSMKMCKQKKTANNSIPAEWRAFHAIEVEKNERLPSSQRGGAIFHPTAVIGIRGTIVSACH